MAGRLGSVLRAVNDCFVLSANVAAEACLLVLMVVVAGDVVLRYVFGAPTQIADELGGYLLVGITFLGASYALRAGMHIKVDLVTRHLSERAGRWLQLAMTGVSLFFVTMITWKVVELVIIDYRGGYRAPTNLATPLFVPQAVIAIGLVIFCLQIWITFAKECCELRAGRTLKR